MKRKIEEKLKAIALRRQGFSVNEIVEKVGVAKGSVSVWVRNVVLNQKARTRLLTRITQGQLKAAESKRAKTESEINIYRTRARRMLVRWPLGTTARKFLCVMIYWCEGAKNPTGHLAFTNSDPALVRLFLRLLRESFPVHEEKFRVCMHLHEYHDELRQKAFWARITDVPAKQFIKSYRKPHTGKRIRDEYPGCVCVSYHDNKLQRELLTIARVLLESNY